MCTSLRSLRRRLDFHRHGLAPPAIRYPFALRTAVVAELRAVRAEGGSLASVALALDLPAITLTRWEREAGAHLFRVVEITDSSTPVLSVPSALVLTTASGLRIEGLDLEQLASLLRTLA